MTAFGYLKVILKVDIIIKTLFGFSLFQSLILDLVALFCKSIESVINYNMDDDLLARL